MFVNGKKNEKLLEYVKMKHLNIQNLRKPVKIFQLHSKWENLPPNSLLPY